MREGREDGEGEGKKRMEMEERSGGDKRGRQMGEGIGGGGLRMSEKRKYKEAGNGVRKREWKSRQEKRTGKGEGND